MTTTPPSGLTPEPTGAGLTVPDATIARLPSYLRVLKQLKQQGIRRVSSIELAEATHVQPALLRRDLSIFGTYGTRGVGYEVDRLVDEIGLHVGSAVVWPLVIVGVGNLGRALTAHFKGTMNGFDVVGLVDADPARVGTVIRGVPIEREDRLEAVLERTRARMVVIAAPPEAAQSIADRVVAAGVVSILNFAPTPLSVPSHVNLRAVDLAQELQILAFHESHRTDSSEEPSL